MKKQIFYFTILFLMFLSNSVIAQNKISGKVTNSKSEPLAGAYITNKNGNHTETSNGEGNFSVTGEIGDILEIQYIGFKTLSIKVKDKNSSYVLIEDDKGTEEIVVTAGGASPASEWIGATTFYNFDSKASLDNVVGAASIKIDEVAQFQDNKFFRIIIVGNIAKIASATDTTNLAKNVREITQSAQGFSVGVAPVWTINPWAEDENGNIFRLWGTANYKVNSFKKEDATSVTLNQFRTTIGLEFEGLKLTSGRKIHIGIEGSWTKFSGSKYEEIFNEYHTCLRSAQMAVIVPLNGALGFMIQGTYSENTHPVYSAGLILNAAAISKK